MSPLLLSLVLAAGPNLPSTGTATLPLAELAPLLLAPAPEAKRERRVLVQRLALKGRPGESGLWLEGAVTVQASVHDGLVKVPLLQLGPGAVFEELPATERAALVMEGQELQVHCVGEGSTTLAFKALLRAGGGGGRQAVSLRLAPRLAPPPLVVDADESLFEVPGATLVREWGGLVVFPVEGRYEVAWKPRGAAPARAERATRPPVEPSIREAEGRWVSTLEGRATHELKLALIIDRPGTLEVTVPQGQALTRARVNGEPRAVKVEDGVARLAVAPASLGDTSATVELSLAKDLGIFHLSGEVTLESPKLSLPVQRWTTATTLPAVFTWRREGGSMELVGSQDESAASVSGGQVPGRTLSFRQHLVSLTAPDLALRYSVDISRSYFRGRAPEPKD